VSREINKRRWFVTSVFIIPIFLAEIITQQSSQAGIAPPMCDNAVYSTMLMTRT
jgi:hypothetical protein